MITKNDFNVYVAVQESGATNMFAINTVCELTGLTKEKILDIMKNYAKYVEQFKK